MVVLSVLGLFEAIVNGLLGLIPTPVVPGLNAMATTVVGDGWFGHLGWANNYFPITDILTAFSLVLGVWGVVWVVKAVLWVLGKFHVVGGD